MQCAFCSATLPAMTVGVLDYLSETCTSGCDGEGRFDVRCPACSRIVASYDLPLGYDARNLAELLGKPESAGLPVVPVQRDVARCPD